ncbi:DUF2914 domain-containing protein [Myxococcota bacterium]|nr:DUF2914 domain-containing protein [Myxococcota bacterium]MBU1429480.1 DUF2914 domain-containing protein [Myxococcota bacterium]MBU1896144.1 DUF2914 domain-containing protein [Myxococcota bacterium]
MLSLTLNLLIALTAPQDLTVTRLAVGEEVIARVLRAPGDEFVADGNQVWAHVTLNNPGAETHVRMRWSRDGRRIWEGRLAVGHSRRWRTWTRMTMDLADVGEWTITVLDDQGRRLARTRFTVTEPEAWVEGR